MDNTAEYLMQKKESTWTADELNRCGEILAAGLHPELKARLTIDPGIVAYMLGTRNDGRTGVITLKDSLESGIIREEANLALCRAAANALERNEAYYRPMLRKGEDVIADFCSLSWEYLQTEAFRIPRRTGCFSMSALLAEAARPNGWIGHNPVFLDRDREHRYSVEQGKADPYLYTGPVSIDQEVGKDELGILDKYAEPVFGTAGDAYAGAEEHMDLETLISRLESVCPHLDMRTYLWFCLQEGCPVSHPDRDLIRFFRLKAPRRLASMRDQEIRRWFHRHYRTLVRICRAEKMPKMIAEMKPRS